MVIHYNLGTHHIYFYNFFQLVDIFTPVSFSSNAINNIFHDNYNFVGGIDFTEDEAVISSNKKSSDFLVILTLIKLLKLAIF